MTEPATSLLDRHQETLDFSKKCCAIAKDLQAEVEKLRFQGGGRRLAMSMAIRSLRKGPMLKEKQAKLEKYAQTLDKLLLMRLDARSIRHSHDVDSLDQRVQDLVLQLEQGRTITAQLMADQSRQIRDHFDQRFDNHERATETERTSETLKASLFFPDIEARHDQIGPAFKGTFKWIFEPPTREGTDVRKWSNFREWLEASDGIYWVSGKPGSGKSTLMKYIVDEPRTVEYLNKWEPNSELIVMSFFFLNLGSQMQKGATGLLRSLIYQIITQSLEMMTLATNRCEISVRQPGTISSVDLLPTWTDERLLSMLEYLLKNKSATISMCAFIDGLDEFEGDEDFLLEIVRILSSAPRCKACLSSRPEQIFRAEFHRYPQCRVQDLNEGDITTLVDEDLKPKLRKYISAENQEIDELGKELIEQAEGVFLWLKLMMKDLIQGSRNSDTIDELSRRLRRTPNTMYGLYRRILQDLDPFYRHDTIRLFQILNMAGWRYKSVTLLGLACTEEEPWSYVIQLDPSYFSSPAFQLLCLEHHKRIISRGGNFIEIEDSPADSEQNSLAQHYRSVNFIHRTAVEFLHEEYESSFDRVSCQTAAGIPLARANISSLFLFPTRKASILEHIDFDSYTKYSYIEDGEVKEEDMDKISEDLRDHFDLLVQNTMYAISWVGAAVNDPGLNSPCSSELTSQVVRIFQYFSSTDLIKMKASNQDKIARLTNSRLRFVPLSYPNEDDQSFNEKAMSFASYWGCKSYIANNFSFIDISDELLESMSYAIMTHLIEFSNTYLFKSNEQLYLGLLQSLAFVLLQSRVLQGKESPGSQNDEGRQPWGIERQWLQASLWGSFIYHVCHSTIYRITLSCTDFLVKPRTDLVEGYLSAGANANTRLGYRLFLENYRPDQSYPAFLGYLYMDETPLACVQSRSLRNLEKLSMIETLLCTRGALHRRRFRFFLEAQDAICYRISLTQSEMLNKKIYFSESTAPGCDDLINRFWSSVSVDEEFEAIISEIVSNNERISEDFMYEEWEIGGSKWLEEEEINDITQQAKTRHGELPADVSISES